MFHYAFMFALFVFLPSSVDRHAANALKSTRNNSRRAIDVPKHKVAVFEVESGKEYYRAGVNETVFSSNGTNNNSNIINSLLPEDSPPLSEYPNAYPKPRAWPGGAKTNSLNHIPPAFPYPKNKNVWSKAVPHPPPSPLNAVEPGSSSAAILPGAREDDVSMPSNTGSQFSLFWPPIDAPKSRVFLSKKLPEVWPPIKIRSGNPSVQDELKLLGEWESVSALSNRLDNENEVVSKNKKNGNFPPVWPPISKYSKNDITSDGSEDFRPALASEIKTDGKLPPVWPPIKNVKALRQGRSRFPAVWPPIRNLHSRARHAIRNLRRSRGRFPAVWPPITSTRHSNKNWKITAELPPEIRYNSTGTGLPPVWPPIPHGSKNDTGMSGR